MRHKTIFELEAEMLESGLRRQRIARLVILGACVILALVAIYA